MVYFIFNRSFKNLIENVLANSKNQLFKMMLSDLWGILGNIK